MSLTALSDDELLAGLRSLHVEGRRLLARLVLHLVEVEERAPRFGESTQRAW